MAIDTHVVMTPSPCGLVPTPTPMPFNAALSSDLSTSVFIDEEPAAVEGSVGWNSPAHAPLLGPFQRPPSNRATVHAGSSSVFFDDKRAARMGDPALTCNDPADKAEGTVIAAGTVLIGG